MSGRLETDPHALIPVAASFVLTPPVIVARPFPVVGANLDAPLWTVVVLILYVPPITLTIADDGGCGIWRRKGEDTDPTNERAYEILFHGCLLVTSVVGL